MNPALTTLTERGQVSIPVALRKQLHLRRGQPLLWEKVSDDECRIIIVRQRKTGGDKAVRGFMKRFHKDMPATTAGWMGLLREGENGLGC